MLHDQLHTGNVAEQKNIIVLTLQLFFHLFKLGHMLYSWPMANDRNGLQPNTHDASDIVHKPSLLEFDDAIFSEEGKRH